MNPDVVTFGRGGWRRGGESWRPEQPFYAVLGDPIGHSLSPLMQNAALDDRELPYEYVAVQVADEHLAALKRETKNGLLAGFNVTAPHKEAVARLCDGRTDQARDLGAVNTVKVEEGRWLGHNTDSGGVLTVLSQAWPGSEPPARGVVLGAGGSGRAALDAMLRWDVPAIELRNRSEAGRRRAEDWLAGRGLADRVRVLPLEADAEPPQVQPTAWVCCLAGGVPCGPYLPAAAGPDAALLLDLRYGDQRPQEPPVLGLQVVDGLPVLMMQGGLSFAWWFGPPVPWTAMRAALP
jgi:shikimate dehydrogenase